MDNIFANQTDEELQLIREMIKSEFARIATERKKAEEPKQEKNTYNEMLFKLYCKGIINEEQLEEKIKQAKKQK